VSLRVRHRIQNHRKIPVHVQGVGRTVVIRVLDVIGPDREPALRELHRVLQLRRPADRAAPDRRNRAAHLDPRVGRLLDAALGLTPVLRQRRPRIGKVVLRVRRNHHQNPVRTVTLLLHLDRDVHRGLPNRHAGQRQILVQINARPRGPLAKLRAPHRLHHLRRIHELRRRPGRQVRHLQLPATRQDALLTVENLRLRRDELLLVLKPVADRDVANHDLLRPSREKLPQIVLRHKPPTSSNVGLCNTMLFCTPSGAALPLGASRTARRLPRCLPAVRARRADCSPSHSPVKLHARFAAGAEKRMLITLP